MPIPLTARIPVPFTPPTLAKRAAEQNVALAADGKPAVEAIKIICRVPTMYERDSFTSALVRGGVVHYSKQQVRDLMLAGVSHLYEDEKFDEIRASLEELWQAGDAANECRARRSDRYIELMERQVQLPEGRKMTDEDIENELLQIQPSAQISEPQRVRVTAIQQDIVARYPPLQMAFADLAEQDTRRAWLCVEIYVVNWSGLEHTPAGNGHGGITRPEAEWLRAQIGAEAFDELATFIFAMHSIDGDEEKNLASLIESSSGLTGSPAMQESMSDQANEAGKSEATPTTETRATGSRRTTGRSSASTKPATKKTAESASIPTADR